MLRHVAAVVHRSVSVVVASVASVPQSPTLLPLERLLPVFSGLNLACGRRESNSRAGSSARIGRPRKTRSSRPKDWWVRRDTTHFAYDQDLTRESKDFVQDALREDYQGQSPLKDGPWTGGPWEDGATRRCGVLALKIGIVPQWTAAGARMLCTMYQILDCHVINYTSPEEWDRQFSYDKFDGIARNPLAKLQQKRGKWGVQTVGALSVDPQKFSTEYTNLFSKAGVLPKRRLTRFFVSPSAAVRPGTELTARHFRVGDYVVAEGRTIGRGFQGVMTRWGFAGGPATHGTTKFHRKPGSIGSGRKKRRVDRGKKLPGHMGNEWRTSFNLKIVRINTKYNVVYVKGMHIGPTHAVMRLFDSNHYNQTSRCSAASHPPLPTFFEGEESPDVPDANGDIFDESLFNMNANSISFAAS